MFTDFLLCQRNLSSKCFDHKKDRLLIPEQSSEIFTALWQNSHDIGIKLCRREKNKCSCFFSTPAISSHHAWLYTDFVAVYLWAELIVSICIIWLCFWSYFLLSLLTLIINHIFWTAICNPLRVSNLVTRLCDRGDQWQCRDTLAAQMSAPGAAGRSSLNR